MRRNIEKPLPDLLSVPPVANEKIHTAQIFITFSVVPKMSKGDGAPWDWETLIDISSLWLRQAARKQEILLIFNTSCCVPSRARSRKSSWWHHLWQENLRDIETTTVGFDTKSWEVPSLAWKSKDLHLPYHLDPTNAYKDPWRVICWYSFSATTWTSKQPS